MSALKEKSRGFRTNEKLRLYFLRSARERFFFVLFLVNWVRSKDKNG